MSGTTSKVEGKNSPSSRRIDLLAVLKGAFAALAAVPLLGLLGVRSTWALVVGFAVIAVEKRNHRRGNRDRPAAVAVALGGLAVVGLALLVAAGAF